MSARRHQNHHNQRHNNNRQSSTTTTTTGPSSIASSQSSSDCAISIFYSYLVAIASSFLVVLGIYLALTKFNFSFLYISLLGLSIEAIGACIYCISNIRSNHLAKRKQRITSNEFTLHNGLNSNRVENNVTRQQQHQQQINTITHILNNATINPTINDNSRDANTPTQTAILANTSTTSRENSNGGGGDLGSSIIVIQTKSRPRQPGEPPESIVPCSSSSTQNSTIDQLPELARRQQQSPEALSDDFQSSTGLLEGQPESLVAEQLQQQQQQQQIDNTPIQSNHADQIDGDGITGDNQIINQSQLSINMVSQFNSQLGDKNTSIAGKPRDKNSPSNASNNENERPEIVPESVQSTSTTNIAEIAISANMTRSQIPTADGPESTNFNESSDLIDLRPGNSNGSLVASEPIVEPKLARRRQAQEGGQQRPSNIRRTLVMGLSGEEEMIEIDEEDLDNMSILPPPYESIATNTRPQ